MSGVNRPKKAPVLGITDHALLRWLERVHGIKIEDFRAALARDIQHLVILENQIIHRDGVSYVIRENQLVSVTPGGGSARTRAHLR